jgi:hypothetical protein
MKTYKLSAADAFLHRPEHPERTARRNQRATLDFDVTFAVFPNRAAMARSIRMQQRRAAQPTDWKAVQPLTPGEGY